MIPEKTGNSQMKKKDWKTTLKFCKNRLVSKPSEKIVMRLLRNTENLLKTKSKNEFKSHK